ncbi:hypothetical protein IP69_06435 [Bosea sp. AAP35]|uniref:hypothetical protein n=1 Tax=Bosea sp. AAP35 TaxID=1523417 RepID=UPI0006B9E234|nr:hypothetical protein [Bosea sp. AAP35]KPF71333.1 hypothetical protein IP69_06435 [Bosea sp. AAP35]
MFVPAMMGMLLVMGHRPAFCSFSERPESAGPIDPALLQKWHLEYAPAVQKVRQRQISSHYGALPPFIEASERSSFTRR